MSTTHRTARRGAGWLAAAAVAGSLVTFATPAVADGGSGTATDPWVPTKTAHISCDSATRFQNYTDGSHNLTDPVPSSDYRTLGAGETVDVRYETGDRYAVMAMYHPANTKWAYILRSCVQFG